MSEETLPAKRGRPWAKGQSGNPAGRPLRTFSTAERIRAALVEELPEVLAAMVKAARGGDVKAGEVLLRLCIAPLKPIESAIRLPLPEGAGLAAQGQVIMQAVSRGEIAPSIGAQLLMGLGATVRAAEVDAHGARLAAIEEAMKAPPDAGDRLNYMERIRQGLREKHADV